MSHQYGTVETIDRLSPSMIRIIFGGDGLDGFESTGFTDQYVNALFVPDDAPYAVPFDLDDARAGDTELGPRGRRFTVRRWDAHTRRLTIDFVVHGDVGHAGRWAQRAEPGDRLQMIGPSGSYRPDPTADWYVMVGDESALPAIGASLEMLAPDALGVVLAVVDGADCEIELPNPAGVTVQWSHRSTAASPEQVLCNAVAALDWPDGNVDVFVHGEAGEVRAVRRHLVAERGVSKEDASISPYWRRDHTDEAWRDIKRQWLADQDTDT